METSVRLDIHTSKQQAFLQYTGQDGQFHHRFYRSITILSFFVLLSIVLKSEGTIITALC